MRRSRAHQLAEQFRVKRQRAEGEEQAQKKRAVIIALLPFYLNKVRVENRKPNRPVLNVDWETRRDAKQQTVSLEECIISSPSAPPIRQTPGRFGLNVRRPN